MTTSHPYVRYRVDLERPFPNEEELVRQIVGAMERANRQVAAKHRHGLRDAHAKQGMVLMLPRWTLSFMRGPMTRGEMRRALRD